MRLDVERLVSTLHDYVSPPVAVAATEALAGATPSISCPRAGNILLEALQSQMGAPVGDLSFRGARVGIGPGSVNLNEDDLQRHAAFRDWAFPSAGELVGHALWLGASYANFASGPALGAIYLISDGKSEVRLTAVLTYPTEAGAMTAFINYGGPDEARSYSCTSQISGDLLALVGACSVAGEELWPAPEVFAALTCH